MNLDLEADVGALVTAFLGRTAVLAVVGTLLVLLVAGWRPTRQGVATFPRRALLAPVVVAVVIGGGRFRLGQLGTSTLVVLALAVVLVAGLSPAAGSLRDTRVTAPLLLVTALGLFACLPETTGAIALTSGVAVVVALRPTAVASRLTLFLVPLGVAAIVAADGVRPGQVVGGVATLGLLAVLPLVARIPDVDAHLTDRLRTPIGLAVAVATHVLVVVAVARGPGIRTAIDPGGYAVPVAVVLLGLAVLGHLRPRTS